MSQGGNNEVARLNVAITGDVAPLAAAAREAEQVVQQSAAKIEQVAAVTASNVRGMGSGIGVGLAGSGIGGAGKTPAMPLIPDASSVFTRIGGSAKDALRPIMAVVSAFSQLTLVIGLVVGAGAAVYNFFTSGSRAAKEFGDEVDKLIIKSDKAFGQFEKKGTETALQRFQVEMDELDELHRELDKPALEVLTKYLGSVLPGRRAILDEAHRLLEANKQQYIKAAGAIQQRFENDTHKEELESARKKKEIRDKELNEIREHTRRIRDFWRDVRGDQVSGFSVEGFQTSNLSQSLDLLARQRGGVDGPKQLRVDYGGVR